MRCGNKRNEREKKGNRDRKEIEVVLKRKKKNSDRYQKEYGGGTEAESRGKIRD